MSKKPVIAEKREHIGIITLNRPDSLNTFNAGLASDLDQTLMDFDMDGDIRAVIIKGSGKGFCAGIDVSEAGGEDPCRVLQMDSADGKMAVTISRMKKPVIASVHNIAVANGICLVAAADLAIAAEGTKFGATAVNLGLFCMGPRFPW